ncbi:hypothetical protein CY0110_19507 [Crocosphaera chwakensis CCY0110]|uniref:Uncharacterized protein n=1 Tax=Crocosphaera chwakensis CCY0110 TaxID=391612 RepID=A3IJN3_9CHRO|nr:hypothetical protein CY0110_19507 [Crocosphaera chwakensis CCY0110]
MTSKGVKASTSCLMRMKSSGDKLVSLGSKITSMT